MAYHSLAFTARFPVNPKVDEQEVISQFIETHVLKGPGLSSANISVWMYVV